MWYILVLYGMHYKKPILYGIHYKYQSYMVYIISLYMVFIIRAAYDDARGRDVKYTSDGLKVHLMASRLESSAVVVELHIMLLSKMMLRFGGGKLSSMNWEGFWKLLGDRKPRLCQLWC